MALIHVNYFSPVLGMQRAMDVILPQRENGVGQKAEKAAGKIPVLYLLHGGSDDHTIWQRRTSIERYALERGLAVIRPASDVGFYVDMKYGYDFYLALSEELPGIVHEFFPNLSTRREDTFIAGLSMGGFGALKMAILHPERYAAAASLSGMVDLHWAYPQGEMPVSEEFFYNYGSKSEMEGSVNDIPFQMEKLIDSGKPLPKFYQAVGTEDFLYEINVQFRDRFQPCCDLTYTERPGTHEWGFWDEEIQKVIGWLPIRKEEE